MLLKSVWSPNFRKKGCSTQDNFSNARCITEGTLTVARAPKIEILLIKAQLLQLCCEVTIA